MKVSVRPYNIWLWIILPVWLLALFYYFPPHDIDTAVTSLFIDPSGAARFEWIGKLEFLHKKIIPYSIVLGFIAYTAWEYIQKAPDRRSKGYDLFYLLTSVAVCVAIVWWLKQTTGVYCPWDLQYFGGSQTLTKPSLSLFFQDGKCWPGGHAGSAFCLFSLYFLFRDREPNAAKFILVAVLAYGFLCSGIRVLQGAHFVSHNIASMLIDWTVSALAYIVFYDRKSFKLRFCRLGTECALILTACYWTLILDLPFWNAMITSAGSNPGVIIKTLALAAVIICALFLLNFAFLNLISVLPGRAASPIIFFLSIIGVVSLASYLLYGTIMTPDMIRNFIETDTDEAASYVSLSLIGVSIFLALPSTLIFFIKKEDKILKFAVLRKLTAASACVLTGIILLAAELQPVTALMRLDKSMRYLIAPYNVMYSSASAFFRGRTDAPHRKLIVDPEPKAEVATKKSAVFVLVIGETTRSANWQLAGYNRETNPELSKLDIISIPEVRSCGTSTNVSLPCMLSRIGRRDYDENRILSEESLPSLLARSGYDVTWVDNQSGSKGTSDGVKNTKLKDIKNLCAPGGCMDMDFVPYLKNWLKNKNYGEKSVLVLHLMGSHGPAYHERSENIDKVFGRTCTDPSFRACDPESIVNAYDASVRYTDRVLADMIKTLREDVEADTALIFVSDHGESLGEKGLFLHGAPYYLASNEQKTVPMVMWFSKGFKKDFGISADVIENNAAQGVSHDNLYHTILGILNVSSKTYNPMLDLSNRKGNS